MGRAARKQGGAVPQGGAATAALAILALLLIAAMGAASIAILAVERATACTARYQYLHHGRILVSRLAGEAKTGDIILYEAHAPTLSTLAVLKLPYSHAGMVVAAPRRAGAPTSPEELHIAEESSAHYFVPGDGPRPPVYMRRGANLLPFMTRLKYYQGHAYIMRLRQPLGEAAEEAIREAVRESGSTPYPGLGDTIRALASGRKIGGAQSARHCFAHVSFLLEAGGITAVPAEGSFLGCARAVVALGGGPLYEAPLQILYDVDAEGYG